MEVTENEINADAVRKIRDAAGLSQTAFWGPVGVKQSVGSRYEGGHAEIPRSVRILIVTRYVAGLNIDAGTEAGVRELARIGNLQTAENDSKRVFVGLKQEIDKSILKLSAARDALPIL